MYRDEFLRLPYDVIRSMVLEKNGPDTGIFIADGNRRLVMAQTGLTPDSKGFYDAYLDTITQFFRKNLALFFDYGLQTLFFPLFGPSLLKRENKYREYVMPELIRTLFQSERWLDFYLQKGIRIKSYGNSQRLDKEFGGSELSDILRQCEKQTAGQTNHTLFYGFFSTESPGISHIRNLNEFLQRHQREPDKDEAIEMLYGEKVKPANFLITSTRMAGLGALPPLITGNETRIYTLIAPGIFALNKKTYCKMLYDLLFLNTSESDNSLNATTRGDMENLQDFYVHFRHSIIGTGRSVGNLRVLDFRKE
ncbi:MAG: hypothetical protein GY757_35645 [bacterium]|nr:hypothetical protein [bacterium]